MIRVGRRMRLSTRQVTLSVMVYYGIRLWTIHYDPSTGRLCGFM